MAPDKSPVTPPDHDHAGHDHDHDHDHAGHDHDHDHDHDHEGHDHGPATVPPVADPARYEGIQGHAVRELSTTERELLAVVGADVLEGKVQREASTLARRVTLKGFRPGKAPVARIKALYGEKIRQDAVEALVRDTWAEAVTAGKLRPAANPVLVELSAMPGEPVRFTLKFEVLPEVRLQGLDAIKPSDKAVKVTDQDVDEEIEGLRASRAELVPTGKDTASPGDHAIVDVRRFAPGADSGTAEPEDTRDGAVVQVGAQGNIPELDRALLGMAVGETRSFTAKFPAEHPDAHLAGQDVPFRITLTDVKARQLPVLDDDFVKSITSLASVAELREEVRRRLSDSRKAGAAREQDEEILKQLVETHPFDVPRSLVEREAESRLRRGLEGLARQGVDVRSAKVDWQAEFERARAAAERDIRVEYLLELVAEEKKIDVPASEVAREIELLARRERTTPTVVRQQLEKSNQMSSLEGTLRRRRALDLLRSGARISMG